MSVVPFNTACMIETISKAPMTDKAGNLIMTMEGMGLPATVRYMKIDGNYWFSEMDVVKSTGKNNGAAADWLKDHVEKLEVIHNPCKRWKFKGLGQKTTNVITFDNAIDLITMLPGTIAETVKQQFLKIGHRYLGGDQTMKKEIDHNAKSTHIINKSARASLKDTKKTSSLPTRVTAKYIYATESPAFPGAIKIGRAKNVKNRLSSGNTFVKLAPHKVVAVAPSFNYVRDEKMAHSFFESRRLKGEFFKVTVAEVRDFFESYVKRTFMDELFKTEQKMLMN